MVRNHLARNKLNNSNYQYLYTTETSNAHTALGHGSSYIKVKVRPFVLHCRSSTFLCKPFLGKIPVGNSGNFVSAVQLNEKVILQVYETCVLG